MFRILKSEECCLGGQVLLISNNGKVFTLRMYKETWAQLGKVFYLDFCVYNCICVCICVRVCIRERERERGNRQT